MSASHQARSVARLAAVQALYQMEVSGTGVEAVVRDGEALAAADEAFFAELVRGVVAEQRRIDPSIAQRLAQGWRLERLDATVRAILRAGAFELAHRPDVPVEVVINEYVDLARSFFEGPEPGFVNAALDGLARDVRA